MTKLCDALTKDQMELFFSGAIDLSVSTTGFFIAKTGTRVGRGRSPRQAVEDMK
jgi:hypothetical protein